MRLLKTGHRMEKPELCSDHVYVAYMKLSFEYLYKTNGNEKGSISLFLGKADIILFFFSLQNMFNWKMISFINPYCVPQLTDEFSPSQWKE